jgi:lycopene cyclase domain-containing protein
MTYTQLAVLGVVLVVLLDLVVLRTRLLRRRAFWTAYAIVVSFQLVTNGVLTGLRIVRYDGAAIVGSSTPVDGPPPFLGDGRIAFAPFEDLLFGFALVVLTQVLWVWLGRRGVQRLPYAGPPRVPVPGSAPDSHP